MDLFKLVARLGLDTSAYEKGIGGAMAKGVLLGNMLTDLVKKGAGLATGLVKTGLTYNQQMEDYTTNFKVMLGSLTAAESKVEELKTMAAKTPFAMEDLAGATQTLLAFGVQSSKTTDVMSKLGDISLGNAQRFASLSNAYGKAAAQGKLTGEVVQMMVDAGFNPLLQISEATGESMEKLQKRMSAGRVSVDELDLALRRATGEGGQFYKGMEEASKTMSGQLSTLEDNWNSFLGEAMSPVSEQLSSKILPKAIESLDKLSAALFGVKGDAEGAKKALFLNSEGEEIDPSANLLTWYDEMMKVWTDGKPEDDATVAAFVEGFGANTQSIIDALRARVLDPANALTEAEQKDAEDKIGRLTEIKDEVEAILTAYQGKTMPADVMAQIEALTNEAAALVEYTEGLANFDTNVVSPWERFVSAAGDASADFLTKTADFLAWCAEDGENAKEVLAAVELALGAIAGLKVGGLIGALIGSGVAIISNLDGITAAAKDAYRWLKKLVEGERDYTVTVPDKKTALMAAAAGYDPKIDDGSAATGLDYVPFDGYRAMLHEGEAVLTKAEARAWRNDDGITEGGAVRDLIGTVRDLIDTVKANPTVLNVNGRALAFATAGDNARAGNDRARDINIGRVRG